ncbi:hypothetical protein [Thermincola potens]|uniref:Uncharacterized protein n=1 Tax=Thermincola potens (strain JR) TaxID=635013 RepID=D5XF91_THEPJ|nr:hypothetical protein [Thermincola potens]ADG82312.1 hypothetical protein TherJR_1456 [Thermincola potens JR]
MWRVIKRDKRKGYLLEDWTPFLFGLILVFSLPAMWLLIFISLIDQYLRSVKLYKNGKIIAGESSIAEVINITENNFWVYLFFTIFLCVLGLVGYFASEPQFNLVLFLLISVVPISSFLISNVVFIKLISKRGPKLLDLLICLGFVIGVVTASFIWIKNFSG